MMQQSPFSMDFSSARGQPDLQQPKARNQPQGQVVINSVVDPKRSKHTLLYV